MNSPYLITYDLSVIDLESLGFDLRDYEIDYQEGGIADPLGQIANWIVSTIGGYISSAITTIGAGVQTIISNIISGTNSLISGVVNTANNIYSIAQSLPKTVTSILSTVESDIMKNLSGVTSAISGVVSQVTNALSSGINTMIGSLNSGLSSVMRSISGIPDTISGIVKNISTSISSSLTGLANSLSGILSQINGAITSAMNDVLKAIGPTLQNVVSGLTDIGKSLASTFASEFSQVVSGISALGAQLSASFESAVSGAFKTVFDTLTGFSKTISDLGPQVASAIQGLGIVQTIENGFAQIQKWFVGLDIGKMITSGFSDATKGIQSAFASLGLTQAIANGFKQVQDFFTNLNIGKTIQDALTGGFKDFQNFFTNLNLTKTLTDAFSGFGSQLKTAFDNFTSGLRLPDLSGLGNFLKAFGSDPLKAIGSVFKLPEEIADFFTAATGVLNKLTEQHSPSILDDIGTFFKNISSFDWGTFSKFLAHPVVYTGTYVEKGAPSILEPLLTWFNNLGSTIFNALQDFGKNITQGMTDLGNYIVDGTIKTFGLPAPSTTIKDPFGKLFSSLFQSFTGLAGSAKSSTPIADATVTNVLEGIAFTLVASEAIQWTGLGLDILHPIKNLQLRKKFKDFINSIGLGHVTSVFGASLVAASLSPLLQRFWNKQSQVRLADPNSLIEMWHRDVFEEATLDAYLSEHGYDQNFRNGLKENFLQIPQYAAIAEAYFRFMGEGKIDRATAEQELSEYLDFFRVKNIPRLTPAGKFSFSEREIVYKLLYRTPSRYERRALNLAGLLDEKTATNMMFAERMRPDLVPLMVKAERLQGSQTYRTQIETAIRTRVTKGFQVVPDLGTTLTTYEFPATAVNYLTKAAEIAVQTTIDEARLKEADENYAQAVWDKTEYAKTVNDVIKNPDVAKEHIATLDITRERNDFSRVRDEGNLAISYELSAFAQGGVSSDEFKTIASTMGKTDDEISRLNTARTIMLKNKIRSVKFGTLQTLLAKRQITKTQFVTKAVKLPYDTDLITATADHVVATALAKAKTTPAKADESIWTAYPSLA
jgi:hypothetical protein